VLPGRNPQALPVGDVVDYWIPLVPNARRFAAGHRIQPMVTSDDQPEDITILLGYRHSPVGTTAPNTIQATSRLLAPVLARGD